jgi:hypothetical protein
MWRWEIGYWTGMRFLSLLLLTMASVVSFAADHSDYLPMAVGMEWTMDLKVTKPDGTAASGTSRRVIGPVKEIDGKTYHQQRTWSEGGASAKEMVKWLRKDDKGVFSLDPLKPKQPEQQETGLPLEVGKKWTTLVGGEGFAHTVVANEEISIQGTVYKDCFHIQAVSKRGILTEDYWEAPKLGCVKSSMTLADGTKIEVALREFKPGNK